jgi:hypothetical protein
LSVVTVEGGSGEVSVPRGFEAWLVFNDYLYAISMVLRLEDDFCGADLRARVAGSGSVCLLIQYLLQSCSRGTREEPVLPHRVPLFSLVPLVWESNPNSQSRVAGARQNHQPISPRGSLDLECLCLCRCGFHDRRPPLLHVAYDDHDRNVSHIHGFA